MKQITVMLEPKMIKEIDRIVKREGLYHSRNDFVRDAAKEKILEFRRQRARDSLKQMARLAISRGWNGEMPTKEERDKWAIELMKEKGFLK